MLKSIDLKNTPCPLNYAKAKIALDKMASGEELEIFLDHGEPLENVPMSLKEDGHTILKVEKSENFARILVKKQ